MPPAPDLVRSIALPADPSSAGVARRFLTDLLTERGQQRWIDAAELAVSEIVTNAVLHAHTELTVSVTADDASVRVEVRDHNPSLPAQRSYDEQATTGRGMSLVASVTSTHGVHSLGQDGKVVWFTVDDASGSAADPLDAWGELGELDDAQHVEAGQGATVALQGVPATLWAAAEQHQDAIIRELTLLRASRGLPTQDLVLADAARRLLSDAVGAAVAASVVDGAAQTPLPDGHPSPLPIAPRNVDATVVLDLPVAAFAGLQDVLDEAESLAGRDELLVRPGLPEVVALRDWACEQVIAQAAGTPAGAWPGTDAERFTDVDTDPRAQPLAWDPSVVASSARGAIAADDANRIVAVSAPLCRALGYLASDLVGRRVVALVPHRFREAHVAGFTRHLTTGEAHALGVDLELPVLSADGQEVSCHFFIEAVGTPSGRTVYTAWITPVSQDPARTGP